MLLLNLPPPAPINNLESKTQPWPKQVTKQWSNPSSRCFNEQMACVSKYPQTRTNPRTFKPSLAPLGKFNKFVISMHYTCTQKIHCFEFGISSNKWHTTSISPQDQPSASPSQGYCWSSLGRQLSSLLENVDVFPHYSNMRPSIALWRWVRWRSLRMNHFFIDLL